MALFLSLVISAFVVGSSNSFSTEPVSYENRGLINIDGYWFGYTNIAEICNYITYYVFGIAEGWFGLLSEWHVAFLLANIYKLDRRRTFLGQTKACPNCGEPLGYTTNSNIIHS